VTSGKRRTYQSTIRRGDAPRLICAAAYRLYSAKGYLATSIDGIAAEAGVARATVFTAVGPKPAILKAVVDQAMAGDDAPVPVASRPWFTEAADEPDPVRSVQLHARNLTWIMQRVVPLLRALEAAATVDADAAALCASVRRQRRTGTATIAANLAGKTALRCEEQVLADMLFTLPPDAYYRLVHEEGWEPEKFQSWLADLLQRFCLP
jgi:TetR/AcrR family transcriptional regulator, regulator of autoinduction and epiphytic fitness